MKDIRNVMTLGPTSVARDTPIIEAARLMRDANVGILPVVDGEVLLGVVTDRDLVVRALANATCDALVADVMSANPVTLSPTDDEHRVEALMAEHQVRRLPVCEEGRLVGIISVGDLAVRLSEETAGRVMDRTGPEG